MVAIPSKFSIKEVEIRLWKSERSEIMIAKDNFFFVLLQLILMVDIFPLWMNPPLKQKQIDVIIRNIVFKILNITTVFDVDLHGYISVALYTSKFMLNVNIVSVNGVINWV